MSEQPLSALAVSPAVFLVIFCRGDVATYGESGNMADHIWSGPDGLDRTVGAQKETVCKCIQDGEGRGR